MLAEVTFLAGKVWFETGSDAVPISSLNIIQVVGRLNIFTESHVALHAYAPVIPAEVHVVEGLLGGGGGGVGLYIYNSLLVHTERVSQTK